MNRTFTTIITLVCMCSPMIQLPTQAIAFPKQTKTKSLLPEIGLDEEHKIENIAQKITVRVLPEKAPDDGASGILVEKQQRIRGDQSVYLYLVLTNNHVLEILKKRIKDLGGKLQVQTFDGSVHKASLYKANFRGNDLGLLWFSSDTNYELAKPGKSKTLKDKEQVFVAGFPSNKEPYEKAFKFTSGTVTNWVILQGKYLDAGYQIGFTNETRDGMSGGPVLDKSGQLIGIDGRGKNQQEIFVSGDPGIGNINPYAYFGGKEEPPQKIQQLMRKFAWGIPFETYTKWRPQKLFDRLEPEFPAVDNQPILIPSFSPTLNLNRSLTNSDENEQKIVKKILSWGIIFIFIVFVIIVLHVYAENWKNEQRRQQNQTSMFEGSSFEKTHTLPPTPVAKVIVDYSEKKVNFLIDGDSFILDSKNFGSNVYIEGNQKIHIIRQIPEIIKIIPKHSDKKHVFYKESFGEIKLNNSCKEYWYFCLKENVPEECCFIETLEIKFTNEEII